MGRRGKLVALAVALVLIAGGAAFAITSGGPTPSPASRAQRILNAPGARYMTAAARTGLGMIASGQFRFGSVLSVGGDENAAPTQPVAATATLQQVQGASLAAPANVRVNNPGADRTEIDQTTQSETTLAANGNRLVAGYNDSQQALIALTAGADLTGYSYSSDGGASWTDGGTLPNHAGTVNLGDPWLASTPDGDFFYSTLMLGVDGLFVGVAHSSDGGRTWAKPVKVVPDLGTGGFESADKPALTSGRFGGGTVLYDAWDDSGCDDNGCFNGLPVARSTDGGKSWMVTYADKAYQSSGCSFTQYIGSQPLVLADGTLLVAAEQISTVDSKCHGAPTKFSEVLFTSSNGGKSFSGARKIASVTPAFADGAMTLAPGQLMRTIEFPSLAVRGGVIYVAWNDGRRDGHSHILLASSADQGATWDLRFVTHGTGDEVQPALTADSAGLHLLYYGRTGNSLGVYAAESSNVISWTMRKISSRSFPGVPTLPQFDPIIASAYMGDYLANIESGSHHYYSWGDNRDAVKDLLWPHGRHDPDVFFAKT